MKENIVGEIPRTKTIKISTRTWSDLKAIKKEGEAFEDVIKNLLGKRTQVLGDDNIKAIKYNRNLAFVNSLIKGMDVGYEFEYNDPKSNKGDFVLDLKIRKIFYGMRSLSPTQFFGVDNVHKHYSEEFLRIYLECIIVALQKEFRISGQTAAILRSRCMNLPVWRKVYYDYNLSDESFNNDIEESLSLSEEEKPSPDWQKKIKSSLISKLGFNMGAKDSTKEFYTGE
jgi:predicted CopG family antitoxin